MLKRIQADNVTMIGEVVKSMLDPMKMMMEEAGKKKDGGTSMVDTRGIGKPPTFKGLEDKYPEWMAKLLAYLRVIKKDSDAWINWSNKEAQPVTDHAIETEYDKAVADDVKNFSLQLFSTLITNCEDDAFKLIQSAGTGNGLEAIRLLSKRYDPKNPGTKRSLLKCLINLPRVPRSQTWRRLL